MKKGTLLNNKLTLFETIAFIGLIAAVVMVSSCCPTRKAASTASVQVTQVQPGRQDQDEPFVVVEEMPLFPGGDTALLSFIARNTTYPESAKLRKVEGRVIIRFCVDKSGNTDRVSVIKGVDKDLDAEATRVVNMLPQFKPGRQGGKAVSVWYMVPVNFALK